MKVIQTVTMTHGEWLARREQSIGASEAGAVIGINPWKTPTDVWLEKIGHADPIEDNLNMRLGRDLEPVIKRLFMEESGLDVRNDNKIRIDDEYDFLTTNLDGMVVGEKVPVEYKTMGKWDGEIPDYYFAQLQHQMMVSNADHIYFVVLVLGFTKQLVVEKYKRDEEFIAKMREELVYFWEHYVKKGVPPPPTSIEDCKKIYNEVDPESILDANKSVRDILASMDALRLVKQNADKEYKTLQIEVMDAMRDREYIEYNGIPLASWRQAKESQKFSAKDFKADHPELYKEYSKTVTGSRRFLLKKIGDNNG